MKLLIISLLLICPFTQAVELKVAVAANFLSPFETIAKEYSKISKDKVIITSGASGKFFAQIENGAPFDVFLSADQTYPKKLMEMKLADANSNFTYAVGTLVLWSADPKMVDTKGEVLKANQFKHLAIANPELAPYGKATEQALKKMGLYDSVKSKFVMGENVGQTHQFVASGNAELGFVPLSMMKEHSTGSQWILPSDLYSPILQDAVMVSASKNKTSAQKFLNYLKTKETQKIIEAFGYTTKK